MILPSVNTLVTHDNNSLKEHITTENSRDFEVDRLVAEGYNEYYYHTIWTITVLIPITIQ